jgi:hypothetical protein
MVSIYRGFRLSRVLTRHVFTLIDKQVAIKRGEKFSHIKTWPLKPQYKYFHMLKINYQFSLGHKKKCNGYWNFFLFFMKFFFTIIKLVACVIEYLVLLQFISNQINQ